MITKPMDVLSCYPVRKNKKQKAAFRDEVQSYVESLGYVCETEKGSLGAQNLVIGDPKSAKYLVTAHYDTPPQLPIPNFITPCHLKYLAYLYTISTIELNLIISLDPSEFCFCFLISSKSKRETSEKANLLIL